MTDRINYWGLCRHGWPVAVTSDTGEDLANDLTTFKHHGYTVTTAPQDYEKLKEWCPQCRASVVKGTGETSR